MRNYYNDDTSQYVPFLRRTLDGVFKGVQQKDNPVIIPRDFVSMSESTENARELFVVQNFSKDGAKPDYVLRPDHTRTHCQGRLPYHVRDVSIRSQGKVFRRGPLEAYRWREFYQYDVDYVYEDHVTRPLVKWMDFCGSFLRTKVNDTTLLRKYVNEEVTQTSEFRIKDVDSYVRDFYLLHPELEDKDVTVDPHFVRGWNYYEGLIFESYYGKRSCAGGGTYRVKNGLYLGIGIGLDRLVTLFKEKDLLKDYCPEKCVVLVYYNTKSLPVLLLDALQKQGIEYVLKRKSKNFIKDYESLKSSLRHFNTRIVRTVIYGDKDLTSGTFSYKDLNGVWHEGLSVSQLISVLK